MNSEDRNSSPIFGSLAMAQYAAVVRMRRQMLLHSLRSTRGKFELGARVFWIVLLAFVCLGVGSAGGLIAHQLAVDGELQLLPLLLWPVLLLWQVVPLMLASAQENVDFNFLLRFPVSFRSYMLLYLCFGIFDPASLLGGVALLGVWIGVVSDKPELAVWMTLAMAAFALFNFLLTRTIFAWIERWLAKRRTREILGMVFVALFLGLQLLNPAWRAGGRGGGREEWATLTHAARVVKAVQKPLPPGLTGLSIELADKGKVAQAFAALGGVTLSIAAVGALLGLRLRAEYRGESLGEAPQALPHRRSATSPAPASQAMAVHPSLSKNWSGNAAEGPIGALFVKELRYLPRSGVMLFGLFAPLVILFAAGGRLGAEHNPAVQYAFPLAVAYGFLPLTRQVCNSLGAEGAGIQLYFFSPTPFRTVMLAKNLLQVVLFLVQLVFVCLIVLSKYGPPSPQLALATFCWLVFALPANLAVGNILSIVMAYRMTTTRLSREQGSVGNGLLSLLIQLLIFAVGLAVYLPLSLTGHAVFAAPLLLLLAVGAVFIWLRVLGNVDGLAANRRETLVATLVRPA